MKDKFQILIKLSNSKTLVHNNKSTAAVQNFARGRVDKSQLHRLTRAFTRIYVGVFDFLPLQ